MCKRFAKLIGATIYAAILLLDATVTRAEAPALINLQGKLTDADGIPMPNASYTVTFRIYTDSSGGSILWTEVRSVATSAGLFIAKLGAVTPIPGYILDNPNRWLGIQVQGFGEMFPRTQLTSAAYALQTAQWNSSGNDLHHLDGQVGIGTSSTLARLNVYGDPSSSQITFTQNVGAAGLNVATRYFEDDYTPGVFWSTENNNAGKPKAGIYLRERAAGTEMHFGTSNSYATGITNSAVVIGPAGNVSVGAPFPTAHTAMHAVSPVFDGNGVIGECSNGPQAYGVLGISATGYAGNFAGNVRVFGTLTKSAGSFKIDHPLDPANKSLSHSFVESPDMMNIYNGVITTDAKGNAAVTMPEWFEALNKDFRYQLTVIGQFAQAIVSDEIEGNQFSIMTDKPNVKVSWQVTGIRQDAYANAHRIPVEEMKSDKERGYYQHPELFSQPEEKGIEWARRPEMMKQMKEEREKAQARGER